MEGIPAKENGSFVLPTSRLPTKAARFYITGETYFGSNGYSLKLNGIEKE